ncbi:MAG: AmmeMemoRadiSam system protein A [bacterium]|jgi:AmmeMemoRadiSam system protein A|nr:AmmeMemoRadiSam system protein A [candidate division KSB1 bacterium]MDH7560540.1 AmmeMemoRadiSam system protein A [bacterium]
MSRGKEDRPGELTEQEKQQLLHIARAAIASRLKGEPLPDFAPVSERLRQKQGAFVTLHKRRALRGCIGYIEPVSPLYLAVAEMAQAAAFEDPRFAPLSEEELSEVDIEISVLSPTREISDLEEIKVGEHGLIVQQGIRKGLLLPQVATECNWDRTTFLRHTCLKAGLPADAYKQKGTSIKVFSAQVFGEKERED